MNDYLFIFICFVLAIIGFLILYLITQEIKVFIPFGIYSLFLGGYAYITYIRGIYK